MDTPALVVCSLCSQCKRSELWRGAGAKEPETDTIADSVSSDRVHLKAHKDQRLPRDCRGVAYGVAYAWHTARPVMASPMSSWPLKTGASWGCPVASACWRQDCASRWTPRSSRAKLCCCCGSVQEASQVWLVLTSDIQGTGSRCGDHFQGLDADVKPPDADLEAADKRQSPCCASAAASLSAMTSCQASISVDC